MRRPRGPPTVCGVRAFYKWAAAQGEILPDPTTGLRPLRIVPPLIPVVDQGDLRRLMAFEKGASLLDRRDAALLSVFIDTGCRLAEALGMRLEDVDLAAASIRVLG